MQEGNFCFELFFGNISVCDNLIEQFNIKETYKMSERVKTTLYFDGYKLGKPQKFFMVIAALI